MELVVNGDKLDVPNNVDTVLNLIQHLKLDQKVVIIEWNQTILEKESHQETRLSDGDKIEIVHFVGGG